MLDIHLLRKDAAQVAERLAARGFTLDRARFDALETERKTLQTRTQDAQAQRNALSKQIGMLKSRGEDASAVLAEVAGLGDEQKSLETRLAALQTELTKLGAKVSTTSDSIHIAPPAKATPAVIATYDDHRMAIAFAVACFRIKVIRIVNPQCTGKTYPDFFKDFAQLTQ